MPLNSFMSWIGGKKALRELIVTLFPLYYERYVEVFGGGGCVVVKHFCNTLFEKFTRHIWLQMVFSNHCMNEGGHDYTIHTHSGLVLHLSWLHHKNDWDISIHFLVYYRNAPSVRYHKDSLPYSYSDKSPCFHNN